ncbi:CAP domain-containing protein [Cytobacillus sp. FJAT-54145]|uniref:CAP domain-containing protein n=1 Tax=Cytobacillus spartinae TaxID=3299023 RepID=A0ABW6KHM5_9BACI
MIERRKKPLRTLIRILLFIAAFLAIGFYLNFSVDQGEDILIEENISSPEEDQSIIKEKGNSSESSMDKPTEGLSTLIGKEASDVKSILGEPLRIDPSAYGYDWWIYNTDLSQYVQVGVKDQKVVTIYAIGENVNIAPFKIGQPVEEIYTTAFIETNINLDYDGSSYRFELNENEINTRPLIQMGEIFAQLYIDKFDATLSSVRFLDAETLIKIHPYELVYVGELLEVSPGEVGEEEMIDEGLEKQIFDITNIMRLRHQLNPLELDEKTSQVALAHSMDMYESNDFSHTSKKFGELSNRLDAGEVFYQLAGENIAANYTDAPAVMEGWLNSRGHRESLLNENFTHIGIGVYKKHYTQNFIQKWEEQ